VVRDARIAFDTLAFDGIPGLGVRLLDHGVTGGLLLYHMTTLYFALLYALGDDTPGNGNDERAWRAFRTGSAGGDYDAVFWWSGIVWATFATAMHNLQQMGAKRWPGVAHDAQLLKLDDDPLAYLGILVDTIEDWDRYLVRRDTHFAGSLPLQGVDVGFAVEDGKIVLILPARRAQRIREELAGSLDGWTSIIEIRASED
jgi:hypothetical protein